MTGSLWCWRCQPAAGALSESKANLRVHITPCCSPDLDLRRRFHAYSQAMQADCIVNSAYLSRRVRTLRNRRHHLQHRGLSNSVKSCRQACRVPLLARATREHR